MPKNFWDKVAYYRKLGLDPLKWVAGCAVKVDLTAVVYPALHIIKPELEKLGISVNPRQDADIFPRQDSEFVVHREVIHDLDNPKVDVSRIKQINPDRAISLIQVHQRKSNTPEKFADVLLGIYRKIGEAKVTFTIGKGHSIITPYPDAEFALFDFISRSNKSNVGYTLANNDTIQLIDPTNDPGSEAQAYVSISNALNDLMTLGCYENLRIYPVYDAPNDEMAQQILGHMKSFAKRYGVTLNECDPLNKRKLIIGATVFGDTYKQPPTFNDKLEAGMEILVSRPFGDLAPINVYLSSCYDEEYEKVLKEAGFSLEEAEKVKNDVVETMKKPNLEIGKTINKHSPEFKGAFKSSEHIAVTGDLSGPGIYIFKEVAEISNVNLLLEQIPLKYKEFVHFATRNFLMDNATAGTNGAVAVIASKDVIKNVYTDLSKNGYEPVVIGKVVGKGDGKVYVGQEIMDMVCSRNLLKEFTITKKG